MVLYQASSALIGTPKIRSDTLKAFSRIYLDVAAGGIFLDSSKPTIHSILVQR